MSCSLLLFVLYCCVRALLLLCACSTLLCVCSTLLPYRGREALAIFVPRGRYNGIFCHAGSKSMPFSTSQQVRKVVRRYRAFLNIPHKVCKLFSRQKYQGTKNGFFVPAYFLHKVWEKLTCSYPKPPHPPTYICLLRLPYDTNHKDSAKIPHGQAEKYRTQI